jgi:hypothetical protein
MKKLFLIVGVSALIFSACKKDKTDDSNTNTTNTSSDVVAAATDNAISNNMFGDVFKQSSSGAQKMDDSCSGKKSDFQLASTCATITITPFDAVSWPKTVTIDFGTTGCTGNDGVVRKGKVVMNVTTWYRDSNCIVTVTPQNYYVNGYKVEGTKVITNHGHNLQGNLVYSDVVTNGKITDPSGTAYRTWNSNHVNEWISGESTTLNPWDDEYHVTGNDNGVTTTGKNYTIVINTALDIYASCHWIRSGVLTLTVDSYPFIVDFGNGACDANATVTVNGVAYPITMN